MVWLRRTNSDWFHLLKSDQWAGCILSLWRSTVKLLSYAFLLKTLLPFLFRSEEHLGPPSKDLHLTDNCNSLHSRLCLLTSHESSFALCIVGDLHPLYFWVLRNTELQSHVFLSTRAGCVCAGSSLCLWDCLWQSINLVHDKWKGLYFSLVCTNGSATRTERSETKTQDFILLGEVFWRSVIRLWYLLTTRGTFCLMLAQEEWPGMVLSRGSSSRDNKHIQSNFRENWKVIVQICFNEPNHHSTVIWQ